MIEPEKRLPMTISVMPCRALPSLPRRVVYWNGHAAVVTIGPRCTINEHTAGSLSGDELKPKYRFGPAKHQFAVEKFEHGLLFRDRLVTGEDSGDDHVATVVESDRQHRFHRWSANQ
jgi:hypothetical protein